MSDHNQPTGQQLTPLDICKKYSSWEAMEGGSMSSVLFEDEAILALTEYAAQQTAEKDARIAELEEEIQIMHGKFVRTNEGDKMHASYAYHEIASILCVPEGGSAIECAEGIMKEIEKKDARIKELEALLSQTTDTTADEIQNLEKAANNYHATNLGLNKENYEQKVFEAFKAGGMWGLANKGAWQNVLKGSLKAIGAAQRETTALREELEERNEWENTALLTQAELEAVKKERDTLKIQRVKDADDFLTVLQVRDEAVKLLGKANDLIEGDLYNFLSREERAVSMDIRQGHERLSSGQTKPGTDQ